MIIKKLKVNNFRSLVNFELDSLGSTTILYGDNNAGKSNVLQLLQLIFQSKIQSGGGSKENFYQGIIQNFENDYYKNKAENVITFSVEIELTKNEIEIDPVINSIVTKEPIIFSISGSITPQISDQGVSGVFQTNKILVNDVEAFILNKGNYSYFPSLLKKDSSNSGELASAFERIINPLNDCVYIIGSNRDMHITSLAVQPVTLISPRDFKNFLHSLYLSNREYRTFELINKVFNEDPFRFGSISFSSDNRGLEIMIQKDDVRYPIKHLGSGVLQTLYMIASVIYSKKKIICVEELEQNLSPERQIATIEKLQSMMGKEDYNLNQLIISSHSPFLFDTKISNSIYLLKHDGEKTVIVAEKKADAEKMASQESAKNFNEHFKPSYHKDHFEGLEDFY